MRYLIPILVVVFIIVAVAVWIISQPPEPQPVEIVMSSDPFPMHLGANTLSIALTQADGSLLRDALVAVDVSMDMEGMLLPTTGYAEIDDEGIYHFPVLWSMMGEWTVNIAAQLPDERIIRDEFDVFVYAVPQTSPNLQPVYQSNSEIADLTQQPNEAWIIIPLGTEMLFRTGGGDDLMPDELRLSVSGRNTLVIQNNDIADHNIGPFYVRAGETLRQTFTEPAEFVGACSVSHSDTVTVIVEG